MDHAGALMRRAAETVTESDTPLEDLLRLVATEARAGLRSHLHETIEAIAPRLRGAILLSVHRYENGELVSELRTADGSIVLLTGMVDAEEQVFIGLGVQLLPPDAQSWADRERPVGVAMGRSQVGDRQMACSGFACLDPPTIVVESTLFRVGSIAKIVTAAGALLLAEEGDLTLDKPFVQLLPRWLIGCQNNTTTVRDIIGHRAGFPRELDDIRIRGASREALLHHACSMAQRSKYCYSNIGYEILGMIIGEIAGCDAPSWLLEKVLWPIGVNHGGYDVPFSLATGYCQQASFLYRAPEVELTATAAGLIATVPDVLALGEWLAGTSGKADCAVPQSVAETLMSSEFGVLRKSCLDGQDIYWFGGTVPGFLSGVAVVRRVGTAAVLLNSDQLDAPSLAVDLVAKPMASVASYAARAGANAEIRSV